MLPLTAATACTKTKGPQVFPESRCRPGKSQSVNSNSIHAKNVNRTDRGTIVAVAPGRGRQWIGIDITYQSIALILKRFQDTYEKRDGAGEHDFHTICVRFVGTHAEYDEVDVKHV